MPQFYVETETRYPNIHNQIVDALIAVTEIYSGFDIETNRGTIRMQVEANYPEAAIWDAGVITYNAGYQHHLSWTLPAGLNETPEASLK